MPVIPYVALNYLAGLARVRLRDNVIAARSEKGRRITLRNRELKIHPTGGETERRTLVSAGEVKDALAGLFGITLPANEKLDAAIGRALGAATADLDPRERPEPLDFKLIGITTSPLGVLGDDLPK